MQLLFPFYTWPRCVCIEGILQCHESSWFRCLSQKQGQDPWTQNVHPFIWPEGEAQLAVRLGLIHTCQILDNIESIRWAQWNYILLDLVSQSKGFHITLNEKSELLLFCSALTLISSISLNNRWIKFWRLLLSKGHQNNSCTILHAIYHQQKHIWRRNAALYATDMLIQNLN